MNRKQLILLLLALVVIGGAGLVLVKRHDQSWAESEGQIGQKLLKNYDYNNVAAIHIKGDTDLTLQHKDDGWHVAERGGYPANVTQIKELLLKMGDLKVAQSDDIGASQLARMHLAEPGKGADGATLLEFKDTQGKTLQSLLLGKKLEQQETERPRGPFGGGGFPIGRYVMLGGDTKTVLTISDALNNIEPKASEWLDKDFIKVEKPQTITFVSTNATNSWKVTRESEAASWTLVDTKPGESFDSNKVSSLSSSFSSPSFVDVVADTAPEKTGLDKPLTVTIETFDHFTYTLKIGHKAENDYNFAFTVTADIPTARTPGKDEKADEKTKLDKEFQEKSKTLEERLKKDQSLAKWTYLVNTWLVDPFIRDRSQLMVEKPPEKSAAETNVVPEPVEQNLLPTLPK